jgi:hypothetical protein
MTSMSEVLAMGMGRGKLPGVRMPDGYTVSSDPRPIMDLRAPHGLPGGRTRGGDNGRSDIDVIGA